MITDHYFGSHSSANIQCVSYAMLFTAYQKVSLVILFVNIYHFINIIAIEIY